MKKKSDLVTWDTSLKVGDIVFSNYTKNELLFQIVSIERRFLKILILEVSPTLIIHTTDIKKVTSIIL